MCVCNPDRSPRTINGRNAAPTPTGFAEIVKMTKTTTGNACSARARACVRVCVWNPSLPGNIESFSRNTQAARSLLAVTSGAGQ
jgi:hypothetical protein